MEADLVVIGGGSGGLAAAKEAARLGAKVVCFDYVEPSPQGSKWGLGGTCVNVGCIPKIIMHNSAKLGQLMDHSAAPLGWSGTDGLTFVWQDLVKTVQLYIKQLNFSYRRGLRSAGVEYINAKATLLAAPERAQSGAKSGRVVEYTLKGERKEVRAKCVLVAVGGRPYIPRDVPGAVELAVTSDDLFSLSREPKKTLVVGASYIALECAGFLTHLRYDVTVCVRSIVLRGFDRQCAEHIQLVMKEQGTKFLEHEQVVSLQRVGEPDVAASDLAGDRGADTTSNTTADGGDKILVRFASGREEMFDTVVYAVGRRACTQSLGCEAAGIAMHPASGKIVVDELEQTSAPGVYAIGDVCHGRPELTPVAIKAGELLARRLFGGANEPMVYTNIPTVVFTPIEYGCCGLSEEDAITRYGQDNIEVFLFGFNSVPVSACHWKKALSTRKDEFDLDVTPLNLSKIICKKPDNKIVGYHCIAMNAGETTQGYALALKCGLTKDDLDAVVGIHPTDAESFHSMTITRRSGESFMAAGGCGGGKCG
ncbi:thioredoxin reductase [Gregarina niphandrodes]|uniref:Thioredoxin reductase n=1 Tax=Gregarina niphandrodes TaxID=110365 RepID=A0A023B5W7_GRENI|nr:thioredoxin reductase [Gregarina niphandrodes]EZG63622.1 thioredoxin reductase [Gregarina niphandrodes]|eukprot:XP_011130662.1 thioredoxin reductase [Gregarina niphandrodes]